MVALGAGCAPKIEYAQIPAPEEIPEAVPRQAMPAKLPVKRYTGKERFIWCVPYAREISGIPIRGDAWTWWGKAKGKYERGNTPKPYAVLVLRKTKRNKYGHIGVVTGYLGDREILVSHANWGWNRATRGRVYRHMRAKDVSPNNDWTQVRFMHPQVGAYGRVYPAYGFIYPPETASDNPVAAAFGDTRQPARQAVSIEPLEGSDLP